MAPAGINTASVASSLCAHSKILEKPKKICLFIKLRVLGWNNGLQALAARWGQQEKPLQSLQRFFAPCCVRPGDLHASLEAVHRL